MTWIPGQDEPANKSPLTVYAVCWQDDSEPWGWEPLSLWFDRDDAGLELQRVVREATDRNEQYLRLRSGSNARVLAEEWAQQTHAIRDYKVQ